MNRLRIESFDLMDLDHCMQRNGKPVEKQGRKVTDLQGSLLPHGGWSASCSPMSSLLNKNI